MALEISLKFVSNIRINNIPALVQIMAWCRPGDKPLSESMMVSLLTHICVTRPQWVKLPLELENELTPKWLGHFKKNVILFRNVVQHKCDIFIWNWSNTMNVLSELWVLMAWCFSIRASVAMVLTTHPCVSRCLRVNNYIPPKLWCKYLTHPPLDKMAAISQTIFSDAFSWIKSFVFWLKFHWSLFLRVQLKVTQHWFR